GETGQLVPPGKNTRETASRFAEAIAPYCTDNALRAAHGAAGEERSREYSWPAINRVVADTYIRLIEDRRALQKLEAAEAAAGA
ncbi:MAG: glycosyltransferase family 1 protein, partial [Pseudomonadota bacterium]